MRRVFPLSILGSILVIGFSAATAAPKDAISAPPVTLTYEQAARLALGENPDLLVLRYQEEAQRFRARQALSPNSPVLAINKNDLPDVSPASVGAATVYSLNFTLGFPGKALSQSAALRSQADASREQAAAKEIALLMQLANNYVALVINRKFYEFLSDEVQKAEQLVKLLEKKYATAQAAQADLLGAKVVVVNLRHSLLDNANEKTQLLTQFRNLIKKPGETRYWPSVPEEVVIPKLSKSLGELVELMLRNRHEIKSARAQVEAASASLANASLAAAPDLQFSGAINNYHVPSAEPISGVARDYSVGLGIAVPLFFPFNELNGIHAAARDRNAAEAQEESLRLQSLSDLQTAYTGLMSALSAIENSQNLVLPAAKASYDLMLRTYSFGKADYFMLNESRKNWLQAKYDLLGKILAASTLYNQLIQLLGCDIGANGGPDACK